MIPDSSDLTNIYPQLALNGTSTTIHININMRPLYRRTDARYLYHLAKDNRTPARYTALRNDLYGVASIGAQAAWLVGSSGIVLRSTDGGNNWIDTQVSPARDLYSAWFFDQSNGVAVGSQGAIFRTLDGGVSWASLASGVTVDLRDVSFASASKGIVVGNSGTILRTNDGGAGWSPAPRATNADLVSVSYSGTSAVASAADGSILRSSNDGETWTVVSIPGVGYPINGVAMTSDNIVLAVADSLNFGRILRSTNAGSTWSVQRNFSAQVLNAVEFSDANTAYAVGNNGAVLRTANAGASWSNISVGGTGRFLDVSISGQNVFISGSAGVILTSANGGSPWTYQTHGTINIAVVDGARTNVFFGLPLHLLNNTDQGNQGLTALFTKMFTQTFSPYQRIDRRKF